MFAKTPDEALASLVKQIDKIVAGGADAKVAAVLNFTGEPTDEYIEQIAKFAKANDVKNVALTTSADGAKFKVNDEAELTVMAYKDKKVVYNFAAAKGGIDEKAVKAIVKGTDELVK